MIEVKQVGYGVVWQSTPDRSVWQNGHFQKTLADAVRHAAGFPEPVKKNVYARALYDQSTIDALQARIAELEKDAGRWRWWRRKYDALTVYDCANRAGIVLDKVFVCTPELMDRVTDAAIAKENSNG